MQDEREISENSTQDIEEIEAAANQLLSIINSRKNKYKIPERLIEQWKDSTHSDIQAAVRKRKIHRSDAVKLLLFDAEHLSLEACKTGNPTLLIDSIRHLCLACFNLAYTGRYATPGIRRAALELAEESSSGIKIPKFIRSMIKNKITETEGDPPDWSGFLDSRFDAGSVREIIEQARLTGQRKDLLLIPNLKNLEKDESAADLLADAATEQNADANHAVVQVPYDHSDSAVKVKAVELFGIRGALEKLRVPFLLKGSPVSSLIFGENGTGKSTIVDAIEFALQGRIGRSTLYDSPISPALRSLYRDSGNWCQAELSDGTSVRRETSTNTGGKVVANPLTVRPGFRLAPISIQRSDILRFLDTGALRRGTILLDYFPVNSENLAIRPDEVANRLEANLTELRIKRTAYSERLAHLLDVEAEEVEDRAKFNRVIQEKIYKDSTPYEFQNNGGWDKVDPETKLAIERLHQVHSELKQTEKGIESKDDLLNPVLHRRQVEVLKAALQGVADEITIAFKEICREHPVNRIDILFGRSGPLSLDIRVGLIDGRNFFPQQIFSEAYRDLLALLFFTSVAKKAADHGQARILILDDVLQSVDAGVRQHFVTHLLENFHDWQLIFTVHDRLWMERLRSLFNSHNHRFIEHQIKAWDPTAGPILQPPGTDTLTKDLEMMMNHGEPEGIVGRAGPLLENLCRELCARLKLMVPYRKDGNYMLADLWAATENALLRTQLEPQIRNLTAGRPLRNLAAHADPKILELSMNEAQHFGKSVLALYQAIRCPQCRRWINEGKECGSQNCVLNIRIQAR